MNKKKMIFLLILMLFVSGCNVRCNINVSPNGSVTEKIKITESKSSDYSSDFDYSKYIDEEINYYKALIKYGNYNYRKINDNSSFGVEFNSSYGNICEYFQDTLFNQYIYRHISCKEEDEFIVIANDTPFLEKQDNEDYSNPIDLNDIKLSISLPIKATENNADYVNDKVYTWEFDENTSSDKGIYLKINKNSLEENKILAEKKEKNKAVFTKIIYIFVAIIVLGVIVLIINGLYKKYKENNLEY